MNDTQKELFLKFLEETKEQQKKDIEYTISDDNITMTTFLSDLWLLKNCHLDFIRESIIDKYTNQFFGLPILDEEEIDCLDFQIKPSFIEITRGENSVYFYESVNNNFEIQLIDKIVVVGTSFIYDFIYEAKKTLSEKLINDFIIYFSYYGLIVEYKNGLFKIKDKNIFLEMSNTKWELPKIIHSFNIAEIKKHEKDNIYFSTQNEIIPVTNFIDYDKEKMERYVTITLPEYIKFFIN